MRRTLRQFQSFDRPVRLLVINQFAINLGFYMLMPYLADYLSVELALAAWLVGLVLGMRNLSQQGMFLVGGYLADRFGNKPMIVAGCALRTVGFGLLGFTYSVPALIAASGLTGFAGALFNPAVRTYLARDAGNRRVEAFAVFNVFYQAGILLGPLVGMALTAVAFNLTCTVAAAVFAVLTVFQARALPAGAEPVRSQGDRASSVWSDWRVVLGNRPFMLFSLGMVGSYVLSFQIYLALPLEARRLAGSGAVGTIAVGSLFAVSGLFAIVGQVPITEWCRKHWSHGRSMTVGLATMSVAFVPPLVSALLGTRGFLGTYLPLLTCATMLALGTIILFPFEMDTIVTVSGGTLVATHYGAYNTICGVGITVGNLLTGTAFDAAHASGLAVLPWLALIGFGAIAAISVGALSRRVVLASVGRA